MSLAPIKYCKNPLDAYGMICVHCNKCGRFNIECCICNKILKPEDKVINIEFTDVFCDYACKRHKNLFKGMDTYENKYEIHTYKKDFLEQLK